ncbi:universal stress protein [Candidatus Bathyarchaeota archaeon]|nr:universal stress protein [Candidatus Bathyarchaeota archaeon]MBT4321158.1 universal stress protein [Candidatus Bathyarchaeota archaeon]MBT4424545.1 universal stress protein [Candidatus Bathyarchaeota archaeon]MBT6605724.1 universal stress protein [Candidatus Bathyarchaeota archaeon]MBT7187473.1 universal stress protein [Candidatus Bathyarchaeota archaeon]
MKTLFNKILIGMDGSNPSKVALKYAADLALEQDAELYVLTVIPPLPLVVFDDGQLDLNPEIQEKVFADYEKQVTKTNDDLKKTHQGLKLYPLLKEGNPAKKIVETAKSTQTDLIVVGNRGTGGILTWMLGSVSRQVTESCTVPVLVVKDQKYCEN